MDNVEKAIANSDLGLNAVRKENVLIVNLPKLNKERRETLVSEVKATCEKTKVNLRNTRTKVNKHNEKEWEKLMDKSDFKRLQAKFQALFDDGVKTIETTFEKKKNSIMAK